MTALALYAEHGSWRCWLTWEESEPGRVLVLELVWQISGMVPRVLLTAQSSSCAPNRSAGTEQPSTIAGPSGHTYRVGLSTALSEVAATVLAESSRNRGGPRVRLLEAGSDVDTSELILRRALDLLVRVAEDPSIAADEATLGAVLSERSREWASW